MAYVSQDLKAKLAPTIKAVCKKYGIKASIAVRNHMTLCLNIKSGKIDFISNYNETVRNDHYLAAMSRGDTVKDYMQVNPYHYQNHFTGKAKEFLTEAFKALKSADWYDESDAMTDYFNTAYYVDLNIGKWNKPYALEV